MWDQSNESYLTNKRPVRDTAEELGVELGDPIFAESLRRAQGLLIKINAEAEMLWDEIRKATIKLSDNACKKEQMENLILHLEAQTTKKQG